MGHLLWSCHHLAVGWRGLVKHLLWSHRRLPGGWRDLMGHFLQSCHLLVGGWRGLLGHFLQSCHLLAGGWRGLLGHFLQSCHTLLEGGGVSWDSSYGFTEMSSCMGMARTSLCKILCISDIITTVAGSRTLSFICQVYWRTW